MADPISGLSDSASNTAITGTDPNAATAASTTSGPAAGVTSSLGSDLSAFGSDLSSFLTSPTGEFAEFGTLAGLGISQANSQAQTNTTLANSLGTLGTPYSAAGAAELGQLEGGPQVGGPLGASITQQTTAAANLGQVAEQNSTGQLTAAQQTQVQTYISQQQAMVDSQLAASGNPDSSARDAAYQQIQNNAATLTQQLIQGNTTMATQALSAVQSTYSNLLNQSLSDASFGFGAQEAAVQTQIASNTQLSQSLNQLFAALAQGFGTALGGNKTSTSTGTQPGTAGVASTPAGGSSQLSPVSSAGAPISGSAADTGTLGVPMDTSVNPGAPGTGLDFSTGAINLGGTDASGATTQGYDTAPNIGTGWENDPFDDAITSSTSSDVFSDLASDPWS